MKAQFIDTLIITGNGLDIYCHLKTRFGDYIFLDKKCFKHVENNIAINNLKKFYKYSKHISENNVSINNYNFDMDVYLRNNKIINKLENVNLWEILLIINNQDEGKDWYNIESFMEKLLLKTDDNNKLLINKLDELKKGIEYSSIKSNINNNYLLFILYICNRLLNLIKVIFLYGIYYMNNC